MSPQAEARSEPVRQGRSCRSEAEYVMKSPEVPSTPAVRLLRERGIPFRPHFYDYEEKGGTAHAAASVGIPEHRVVKTLVMEDEERRPLIVLQHGDRQVSTKRLARLLGVKKVQPCDPATAQRHTGYMVGGTSPLGTRRPLPVYAERTVLELESIALNGGRRGLLVEVAPGDLLGVLHITAVEAATDEDRD